MCFCSCVYIYIRSLLQTILFQIPHKNSIQFKIIITVPFLDASIRKAAEGSDGVPAVWEKVQALQRRRCVPELNKSLYSLRLVRQLWLCLCIGTPPATPPVHCNLGISYTLLKLHKLNLQILKRPLNGFIRLHLRSISMLSANLRSVCIKVVEWIKI
ncbi:uncharacterized protein LOC132303059 [Cornus florida]|uniref:uncharacterized protein LOC132303059 n=1 Tax=Cornus florida TaxID=4283 RepID=UPI00289B3046|nr:uncharacterized protein LOC132303059 [Cornus florida]